MATAGRFGQTVHVDRADDKPCPDCEEEVHVKAEQVNGQHRGDNDGEGGGEALQDVVGVFDHHGHQETAERLVEDDAPNHVGVAKEEALLGHSSAIVPPQSQHAQRCAEDSQLHVPHPHGGRASLQDFLKVNARKA